MSPFISTLKPRFSLFVKVVKDNKNTGAITTPALLLRECVKGFCGVLLSSVLRELAIHTNRRQF